jgi:histone H3/H4
VQETLEKACYDFAQKFLEDVLKKKGWYHPESIELNWWPEILLKRQNKMNLHHLDKKNIPIANLLGAIAQLRHIAVHRVHLSAKAIAELIYCAELLLITLKDETYLIAISDSRKNIEMVVDELAKQKTSFGSKITETKKMFARRKAELELEEIRSTEACLKEGTKAFSSVYKMLDGTTGAPNTHAECGIEDQAQDELESDDEFYESLCDFA